MITEKEKEALKPIMRQKAQEFFTKKFQTEFAQSETLVQLVAEFAILSMESWNEMLEVTNPKVTELIEDLGAVAKEYNHDPDQAHEKADKLLLKFINNDAVSDVFDRVEKWYS